MKLRSPRYVVLIVESLDRSLEWYTRVLGLKIRRRSGKFAQLETGQTLVCLYDRKAMSDTIGKTLDPAPRHAPGFSLGFLVEDVDGAYSELCARGADPAVRPRDRFWGQRTAYVRDPDGHYIELASPRRDPRTLVHRFVDERLAAHGRVLGLSTATEAELENLEWWVNAKLPPSYRTLLTYKHFMGLEATLLDPIRPGHTVTVVFFGHPIDDWKDNLRDLMCEAYEPEVAQRLGLIPCAVYGDFGVACFDTTRAWTTGEYPIVLWDLDHPEEVHDIFADLYALIGASAD